MNKHYLVLLTLLGTTSAAFASSQAPLSAYDDPRIQEVLNDPAVAQELMDFENEDLADDIADMAAIEGDIDPEEVNMNDPLIKALSDPKIQQLLQDPEVQQELNDEMVAEVQDEEDELRAELGKDLEELAGTDTDEADAEDLIAALNDPTLSESEREQLRDELMNQIATHPDDTALFAKDNPLDAQQ